MEGGRVSGDVGGGGDFQLLLACNWCVCQG